MEAVDSGVSHPHHGFMISTQTVGAAEVEKVVEVLKDIELEAREHEPLEKNDGLACFDFLYTKITENVLRCVVATALTPDDPRFHDRPFMAEFDVAFADRYFNGIGLGGHPTSQPRCWRVLLGHREDRDISPLIFAVAGVNAHVNFDLPFAVVTACMKTGHDLGSGTTHEDYQMINQIFAEHMQQLRQHFEARFAKGFDKAWVSKIENSLGNLVVRVARDAAWNKALELWAVRDDPAEMTALARSRDRWVALATEVLFTLDHIPTAVFKAMDLVPGPVRRAAGRGLSRTGWGTGPHWPDHNPLGPPPAVATSGPGE